MCVGTGHLACENQLFRLLFSGQVFKKYLLDFLKLSQTLAVEDKVDDILF